MGIFKAMFDFALKKWSNVNILQLYPTIGNLSDGIMNLLLLRVSDAHRRQWLSVIDLYFFIVFTDILH